MTRLVACSIHDSKAEYWMRPTFFQSTGQAVRMFGDLAREDGSEVNKHPEDYNLYKVAEFDEDTGEMIGSVPVHLIAGANVKEIE